MNPGSSPARWWHVLEDGRIRCELCPRFCVLKEGQSGHCGVRHVEDQRLVSDVCGGTSGLAVDPIEKKPLYHFLPGSAVLSFGTKGCNLDCSFCQNWQLSDPAADLRLRETTPEELAKLARSHDCASLAFTYNEPTISAEFCIDVAAACRSKGIRTVAVTNGFMAEKAREEFFGVMDAANVDLKAFSEGFYRERCGARLAPVLETLEYLAKHTHTWLEVTTLLIPGLNDGEAELHAMGQWFAEHLGIEVPWHFSAFHPDHHLTDRPLTPFSTLNMARTIARSNGIRYVYLGNVRDAEGSTTFCPSCGTEIIERAGFRVLCRHLEDGRCKCGAAIAGVFR